MSTIAPADPITPKLLDGLNKEQQSAVLSKARRLLIIAGAGSGKTEVMARRIAWLVHTGTPKDAIVAFTFTEKAAEEMKFRIRKYIQLITPAGDDVTLGGMYIGTIHGFCLKMLREHWADSFYNFDILDELGRLALVQKGYHGILGLKGLESACGKGQYATIDFFLDGYDLLQEYGCFEVELPAGEAALRHPERGRMGEEGRAEDGCRQRGDPVCLQDLCRPALRLHDVPAVP